MKSINNSSSFAENQLKKYGWKQGEGIGKSNQGIVDPIKASFKFDNSGVGFNLSDEFTVNWWEHLYNHNAKKIDSNKDKKTTENDSDTKEENTEQTDASNPLNKKSFFYSRFQKGSVLVDGQTLKTDESKTIEIEPKNEETYDKKGKKFSDEELFKICKGRTAHKGARHGIKMNGKLARIQEQEEMLMKSYETNKSPEINKKKRKKALDIDESQSNELKVEESIEQNCPIVEEKNTDSNQLNIKKKKKKNK